MTGKKLGKLLAKELAARGLNIILHSDSFANPRKASAKTYPDAGLFEALNAVATAINDAHDLEVCKAYTDGQRSGLEADEDD